MAEPHRSVLSILVVDDEVLSRECLKRALVLDGHIVELATNGLEGLVLFETDKFDLVILDYEMPEMKGDELVLTIKALAPNQPIAMVTAYPEKMVGELLNNLELAITKPFDPQELRATVQRLFVKS